MDLSSSGRSPRTRKGGVVDPVTLVSYNSSQTLVSSGELGGVTSLTKRFTQRKNAPISAQNSTSIVAKKSEKFFRTLRKRSKSATRLNEQQTWGSEQNLSNSSSSSSNNNNNSLRVTKTSPELAKELSNQGGVALVGFSSTSNLDLELALPFGGSTFNLNRLTSSETCPRFTKRTVATPKSFSTLKTSREVKMERERLRQERLAKNSKRLFMFQHPQEDETDFMASTTRFLEEQRVKFFDEAREKLFNPTNQVDSTNDLFAQFVRENHDRLAQMLDMENTGNSRRQQQHLLNMCFLSDSAKKAESRCQEENEGKRDVSQKKSNQNGDEQSSPRVHKIEIQRENVGEEKEKEKRCLSSDSKLVQRTLSSSSRFSSSSSSGFSSIEGSTGSGTTAEAIAKLHRENNSHNTVSVTSVSSKRSAFHHPTFINHFGYFGRVKNFHESASYDNLVSTRRGSSSDLGVNPNCKVNHIIPVRTVNDKANNSNNMASENGDTAKKVPVIKSKSVSADFGDMHDEDKQYRYHHRRNDSEEIYGDSETESDEEEEDDDDEDEVEEDDDLDSVSVVAAKTAVSTESSQTACKSLNKNQDNDSGRGESPEVCSPMSSASTCAQQNRNSHHVVLRRLNHNNNNEDPDASASITSSPSVSTTLSSSRGQHHINRSVKAPRPISAVPSEYSDISTSSCRSTNSEPEEESDQKRLESNPEASSQLVKVIENDDEESMDERMAKVHRVAQELLTTEELYVSVLHLIDQVFHSRVAHEQRTNNIFQPDTLPNMFANIKSIYKFHAEFLLPQLQERMEKWNEGPEFRRIGDIIVKFSPFFKMYTEYVKNFDNAISTINTMYQKNSRFQAIMDEIHSMPECRNLSLQHHMLNPVQRIPRYELLLKDYLKKLPVDSPDRPDSEKALHLVSTAAAHANDAMKRIEKFKKLLEVQDCLGGTIDLVSPTRELVKEGKIVKISSRSGDHQDRYLFLFSDLLLLCSTRLLAKNVIPGMASSSSSSSDRFGNGNSSSGNSYRLRAKFEVDHLQVFEGDNLVTANTFYIRDDHKSVELYTHTREEKESWLQALCQTMKDLYDRKSSLRIGRDMLRPSDAEIGRRQPHLLRLEFAAKCMADCGQPFSMMRKKHNCRACGRVVCAKCSNQKFPLSFENDRLCRVCRACYQQLLFNQKQQIVLQKKQTAVMFANENEDINGSPEDLTSQPRRVFEMSQTIKAPSSS